MRGSVSLEGAMGEWVGEVSRLHVRSNVSQVRYLLEQAND